MAKFYMRWKLNRMLIPTNPEDRVKLWLMMLKQVKAELKSGAMTDGEFAVISVLGMPLQKQMKNLSTPQY